MRWEFALTTANSVISVQRKCPSSARKRSGTNTSWMCMAAAPSCAGAGRRSKGISREQLLRGVFPSPLLRSRCAALWKNWVD